MSRCWRIGVFILAACLADAQGSNPTPYLTLCGAAMGTQNSLRDFYAEGFAVSFGHGTESAPLVLKSKGVDRYHVEENYHSGAQISNVNRGTGFQSVQGHRQALAPHTIAYFRPEHNPALGCATDFSSHGMTGEYVGQETFDTRRVHHVRFTATPVGTDRQRNAMHALLSERHVFIDTTTNLVYATRTWVFAPNAIENRSLWETVYSDYRNVNGVMMPFHLENRINGQKVRDVTFTQFRTDMAIADSDFN